MVSLLSVIYYKVSGLIPDYEDCLVQVKETGKGMNNERTGNKPRNKLMEATGEELGISRKDLREETEKIIYVN